MKDIFQYEIRKERNYGFTHTSAEAVQQLKFLRKEIDFTSDNWPLISRSKEFGSLNDFPATSGDVYVIEISSLKLLTINGICVQINYVQNEFRQFFDDNERVVNYWRIVSNGTQKDIDNFLNIHWASDSTKKDDCRTLRLLRRSLMTEDQIRDDIRYLIKELKNVLFITHVNASKSDGNVIASRSKLINTITKIVKSEGGNVYDPTPRMLSVGQVKAIEDHSDSLAHFTDDFAKLLCSDWNEQYFSNWFDEVVLSNKAQGLSQSSISYFRKLIEHDDDSIIERMMALLVLGVDNTELKLLAAKQLMNSGIHASGIEILKSIVESVPENGKYRESLINGLCQYNHFKDAAKEICNAFESGLTLSNIPFEDIFLSLFTLNDNTQLLRLISIFLQWEKNEEIAAKYLENFAATNPENIIPILKGHIEQLIPHWSIEQQYRYSKLYPKLDSKINLNSLHGDTSTIINLISIANENKEVIEAAHIFKLLPVFEDRNTIQLQRNNSKLWTVLACTLGLIDNDVDTFTRFKALSHLILVFPHLKDVRQAYKVNKKTMLSLLREYESSFDTTKLILIANEEAIDVSIRAYCSKVLARLGIKGIFDLNQAYDFSVLASELDPDSEQIMQLLMRLSSQVDEIVICYNVANKLLYLVDIEPKLQAEAELFIKRLPRRAFLLSREVSSYTHRFALLEIAKTSDTFFEKVDSELTKLKREWVREIIQSEKNNEDNLIQNCKEFLKSFKEERVNLAVARSFTKLKDFTSALPFWQLLLVESPQNEMYITQHEKCKAKVEGKS
jgi:tetratricopeptide (TPR) repeat protein